MKNLILIIFFVSFFTNAQQAIIPIENKINYPESWDLVPTKQEALDFISFEQIQRELGF